MDYPKECLNGHLLRENVGEMCEKCRVVFYFYLECYECGASYVKELTDECLCVDEEES